MLTCCAHTIQNNAIQSLTAKIGVTWDNSAIFPSHLPLWNNAARYEWTTVRKVSGMVLKAGWNTVLHYQRARHWPVTLHTVVLFRFFFAETSSHEILQQTSNAISMVRKEQCTWKHALRWATTAGNRAYPTTERNPNPDSIPHSCPFTRMFSCAHLPVSPRSSQVQSEGGEECPIYEFCPIQWHIVIRKPQRTIPIQAS